MHDKLRYRHKSVRAMRRRHGKVRTRWESRGWEFTGQDDRRFRTNLTFQRVRPRPHWGMRIGLSVLTLAIIAGLVFAGLKYLPQDPTAEELARADAAIAMRALRAGDLAALEQQLAERRGDHDFAYFFALEASPRELGDALASVAGTSEEAPLNQSVDAHQYELTLTDLAGVLALATHGTGDRYLPTAWADDFVTATTTPEELYGSADDGVPQERVDQDLANKQNLLLLLSRGYWSTEFLEALTAAYWMFDRDAGGDAWPGVHEAGSYAPSPSGAYLSDGILALTAALTANPEASAWAFTEFLPGTETVNDDDDHALGKFTHYLFFEHDFPGGSDEGSVGMTASLTALSSAIDATTDATGEPDTSTGGPHSDAEVLEGLANSLRDQSDCSLNPLDYGHCVVEAFQAVFGWVKRWGHSVLDILSLATFAPPPFSAIGIGAASTNATWYAIEGDYTSAGLSLATAVPGIAFTKLVKGAKGARGASATAAAEKAAAQADDVARVATAIRAAGTQSRMSRIVSADDLVRRPNLSPLTKAKVRDAAPKNADGDFIDPNTGTIVPSGVAQYGHKPGHEWRCIKAKALSQGWSKQQLNDFFNDPAIYQMEDPVSNQSHRYEADVCAR